MADLRLGIAPLYIIPLNKWAPFFNLLFIAKDVHGCMEDAVVEGDWGAPYLIKIVVPIDLELRIAFEVVLSEIWVLIPKVVEHFHPLLLDLCSVHVVDFVA